VSLLRKMVENLKAMEKLVRSSMQYTVLGLASGVYYRELTRRLHVDRQRPNQLRAVHGHCLTLGGLFFLLVLLLERSFHLFQQRHYRPFYVTYHIGLGLTITVMLLHGTLTTLGKDTSSRWITWSAGLGHTLMAVGFGYFYGALQSAVRASRESDATARPASSVRGGGEKGRYWVLLGF
jgi:hypothetical protein